MRMKRMLVVSVATVAAAGGCGTCASSRDGHRTASPASWSALPCADAEQKRVALDTPGPGQPSPEEAVAPYAGALELESRVVDGDAVVVGLRRDGSIFRTYHVTEHADGWWPDGWSECRP